MTELEKWKDKCRRQFEETRRERQAREEAEKAVLQLQGLVDAILIGVCVLYGNQEEDGTFNLVMSAPAVEASRDWRLQASKGEDGRYILRAARREEPPDAEENEEDEETPSDR